MKNSESHLPYIKNLDALRAFAAFGVIVAHGIPAEVNRWAPFGNTGVSLFFVLSGFVITRILFRTVHSGAFFRNFYFRRSLRIFPLYYAALLCYYLIPYLSGMVQALPAFSNTLPYILYYQNISRTFGWPSQGPGHYWSLAVEEHFYLIWPAIIYIFFRRKASSFLYISLFIVLLTHCMRADLFRKGIDINLFTLTRLDQLVFGSLIAFLELKGLLRRQFIWIYLAISIVGLIAVGWLELRGGAFAKEVFKHTGFGLMYGGVIMYVSVLPHTASLSRILQSSPLQYLGKISYGIYVWHNLVFQLFHHYVPIVNHWIVLLLVSAVTIVVSALSFRYLESPFLRMKDRFQANAR